MTLKTSGFPIKAFGNDETVRYCISERALEKGIFMKRNDDTDDEDGWEYGDVWDQGTPDDEPGSEDAIEYVEVLRGDTGMGYSDTTMMEYILYLGAAGIQATFDAYPLREIKIYVLKVEAGREEEAMSLLREKLKNQG